MNTPILRWSLGLTTLATLAVAGIQWPRHPEPGMLSQQPAAKSDDNGLVQSDAIRVSKVDGEELAKLRRLADELRAQRTQLRRLAEEQVTMRQQMNSLPESTVSDPESDFIDAAPEEEADMQSRQQQAILEKNLSSEKEDAQWANEALTKIEEGFHKEELSGINLIDAGCRSTLCEVNLSIDSDISTEEGMQRLSAHRPWDGPTFFVVDSDGIATLYFARDGYDLPAVPNDQDTM